MEIDELNKWLRLMRFEEGLTILDPDNKKEKLLINEDTKEEPHIEIGVKFYGKEQSTHV